MAKGEGQEGKSGSPMKWIVMIVIPLVLAGGGYFGWTKLKARTAEAPAENAGSHAPVAEQSVKQDMGTFLVNLADTDGKRYLRVTLQFEVTGPSVATELTDRSVEIRDMILMLLSSKAYDEIGDLSGKVLLKQELVSKLNRVLQRGQVKEIYFTEFLVQ